MNSLWKGLCAGGEMAAFPESPIDPDLLQASAQTHPRKCDGFWDPSPVATQRGWQCSKENVCIYSLCKYLWLSLSQGSHWSRKGAADLPELVCVSSQCRRLGIAGGCVAFPLQPCSCSPFFTCQTLQICFGFPLLSSPSLSR